ncbi:MAG: elongation factor P [Flavobacteriales bacterium]|nr:elongation factor P [Flavobacteriales bacterium]
MAKASDMSNGNFIKYNGDLYVITELIHRTPGNLRAFYQAKMRNVKSGKIGENRFRPDEEVEIVRVEERELQYLYKDGNAIVCMDTTTFDQIYVDENLFGDSAQFLKEGLMVIVSFDDNDSPVYAKPPKSVELEVTYTEPGVKGDTATNTMKPATLETGAEIRVPLFINNGERIKVNPETGEYMERVK